MKLTKTEFKSMIKECIRELVKEGAFNEVITEEISNVSHSAGKQRFASDEMVSNKSPVDTSRAKALAARMAGYDDLIPGGNDFSEMSMPMNDGLKKLIETTSSQMGKGDSKAANAYAAILADTAMHTLPQQMAQDTSRGGGYGALAAANMQGVQEKVAPQQLQAIAPSGDVTHWAKLAFGKYGK